MKPWAQLPFELIKHADEHAKSGNDFDRRMALIGFDNAIEVSIITYLSLNPIQRDHHQFPRSQVLEWEKDFHSKLRFLEHFVTAILKQSMQYERDEIVFYHDIRNDMYHRGIGVVPAESHINGVRTIALWVFKTLFKTDAETLLLTPEPNSTPTTQIASEISYATPNISDQTKFLELIISIRRDLNMLMRMTGELDSHDSAQVPSIRAWETLFSTGNPPSGYDEALKKAETLRSEIVEGNPSGTTEPTLKRLSDTLAKVSGLVRSELQSFQVSIVEKSLDATLSAIVRQQDRRAGIVWQTPGSGMVASMMAYIEALMSLAELGNVLVLIASDRNDLMEQTLNRFNRTHPAQRIASTSELIDLLKSNDRKVAFTTIQKLLALRNQHTFQSDKILFVGNNLRSPSSYIKQILPNAVFILFTTSFAPEAVSVYGDLIAKYGFQQAIKDNIVSNVRYEIRDIGLSPKAASLDADMSREHQFENPLSREWADAIAKDLVQHYERRNSNKNKAVVVTSRIDYAKELYQSILNIRPEWLERGVLFMLSTALEYRERTEQLMRFANLEDPSRIAIVSSGFLPLIQAKIKTAYLLHSVPKTALVRTVGLVSRGLDEEGLVVDYDHNMKLIREAISEVGE